MSIRCGLIDVFNEIEAAWPFRGNKLQSQLFLQSDKDGISTNDVRREYFRLTHGRIGDAIGHDHVVASLEAGFIEHNPIETKILDELRHADTGLSDLLCTGGPSSNSSGAATQLKNRVFAVGHQR